jgi:iron complex transport system substrate-binding protein
MGFWFARAWKPGRWCRLFLISALGLSACGGSTRAIAPLTLVETTTEHRLIRHAFGETRVPLDPQRVLALGEEGLLADLLDLGARPVAASVNVPENVPLLTSAELNGIALFPSAGEISLEALSAYQPDLIIGTSFFIEQIGYERLNRIAPTVALGGATPLANYVETATVFGRGDEAQRVVERFRAEIQAASKRVDAANQRVSLITVYPGPSVALWFDGPSPIPLLLRELGVQLRPDPAANEGLDIRNGRAFISLEQLPLVDGDTIFLLISTGVEGEDAALADVQANPLWQQLPAVQTDRIVTLDRIGYPGLRGQRALLADLIRSFE